MTKLWSFVLVFSVCAFLVAGAYAADEPKKEGAGDRPTADSVFKKLDTDNDGKLTVGELAKSRRFNGDEAKAKESLAKMDENKDGSVCCVEWGKAWAKRGEHHKKGDGKHGDKKDAPEKQ